MLSNGNCTRLLEIKDKLKSVVSTNKVGKNSQGPKLRLPGRQCD